MKKTKTTKRKATKKVATPQFPSRFKIGQDVTIETINGTIKNCRISGVTFEESKVYYNVDVLVRKPFITVSNNVISHYVAGTVTFERIDSICIH